MCVSVLVSEEPFMDLLLKHNTLPTRGCFQSESPLINYSHLPAWSIVSVYHFQSSAPPHSTSFYLHDLWLYILPRSEGKWRGHNYWYAAWIWRINLGLWVWRWGSHRTTWFMGGKCGRVTVFRMPEVYLCVGKSKLRVFTNVCYFGYHSN